MRHYGTRRGEVKGASCLTIRGGIHLKLYMKLNQDDEDGVIELNNEEAQLIYSIILRYYEDCKELDFILNGNGVNTLKTLKGIVDGFENEVDIISYNLSTKEKIVRL